MKVIAILLAVCLVLASAAYRYNNYRYSSYRPSSYRRYNNYNRGYNSYRPYNRGYQNTHRRHGSYYYRGETFVLKPGKCK
ncbi:hypothetical protein EB796_020104 [Bugula neritina]|uniref:Uncharacterized protein n=1 Tax=Bugula neritina TaxID=10212 RepID=A0A7J7J768_BUGNE|nr:hypothetical protein EB796_020104 [Bugula neritina]